MKIHKLAFVAIMAAAALSQVACVTHYQIKAAYEREARMNLLRGKPALCTVGDEKKYVAEVEFWEMVIANWPDYAKEGALWVIGAAVAWYIYDSKDDGETPAGDTIINHYYPAETAADGAGGDDDGGAAE